MMNQEQVKLQAQVDMLCDGVPLEEMTLAELFEESDRVGDKYLTTEEIQARDAQLRSARERLNKLPLDELYDELFSETDRVMTLAQWAVNAGFGRAIESLPEYSHLWGWPHFSVAAIVKARIVQNS